MADTFNPGDRVRLKSGGPEMTVVKFGKFTLVEGYLCQWFDAKSTLQSEVFTEPTLELVPARANNADVLNANVPRGEHGWMA